MSRVRVDRRRRRALHDLAEVHDGDVVGDVTHHGEIMRDEQIRQPAFRLQVGEQIQDLRLHRHVERADRLIAHHELRLDRQRPRDPHALPLAARQFVRIAFRKGSVESDLVEQRGDGAVQSVNFERLPERLFDRHTRIERAVGILEYDLHPAPQRAQARPVEREDVVVLEQHLPRCRLLEPEHRASDRRLPRARLAHQSQGAAGGDRKRHAVHGAHRRLRASEAEPAALAGVVLHQIAHVDEHGSRLSHCFGTFRSGSVTSQQRAVCPVPTPVSSSGGSCAAHFSQA